MSSRFTQWASLSPWSIISFSLHALKMMLSNGYALIPVIYTGWQQGFSSPWVILVISAIILAITTFAIVQWSQYRFRVQDHKLGIKQGLLFKRTHEIPLNKIQNVRLEQPLYFRPLGLFSLVVETAGSKQDEAVLSAVNYRQAMQLKQRLFIHAPTQAVSEQTETAPVDGAATAPSASSIVVQKQLKDLLIFGLYQNNLFWLSIIFGSILGQLNWDKIGDNVFAQALWQWYQTTIATSLMSELLFALSVLLLLSLLLALISIASAVLKYHPYKLSLRNNTLHRTGGLLAKQHDVLALSRVQLIRFNQPILGRLFKRWTANFKQVKGTEIEQHAKRHMLIPSMTPAEITSVFFKLSGLKSRATELPSHYQGIDIGWFWRRAYWPPLVPLLAVALQGLNGFTQLMWLAATLVVIALYLRYRQWGYRLQGHDLWIHTGMLGHSWQLLSLTKVQHVCISQTSGQRRKHLATLHLGMASGEQTIPYLSITDARLIAETALSLTKYDHNNWI
ncbi:PH domain-containing protein [Shewanella algidipiscicola]|uniref:PH domain-containing protein n=1 Tax=Shewanella algidipiscicola TaxID=614070 RepID=UPI000D787D11|nr:PH domain-containing protein [Shewanella algidipiscicola]